MIIDQCSDFEVEGNKKRAIKARLAGKVINPKD